MNIFVFDTQLETSEIWQSWATAHYFKLHFFQKPDRLRGHPSDAQIMVVDQSIAPYALLSTVAMICQQNRTTQVITTGTSIGVRDTVELMVAGAAWVFSKPLSSQQVFAAMPGVIRRAARIASMKQEYEHLDGLFSTLTTREKDVLNHILVGTSNKETAHKLNVSVRTIESRRSKVYRKLEVINLAELVRRIDRRESLGSQLISQPPLTDQLEFSQPKGNGQPSSPPGPHDWGTAALNRQTCS